MRKNWKRRGAWAVVGLGALILLAACGAVLQSSIEDPPRGQEPEPATTATTS